MAEKTGTEEPAGACTFCASPLRSKLRVALHVWTLIRLPFYSNMLASSLMINPPSAGCSSMSHERAVEYVRHISADAALCRRIWLFLDAPAKTALQAACFMVHSDARWYAYGLPSVINSSDSEHVDCKQIPRSHRHPSKRDRGQKLRVFFEIVD